MKNILFFLLFFSFLSCEKEIDKTIPDCIRSLVIDDPNTKVKTIKAQKVGKELHYWLNTDHRHADGPEYIISNTCDTLCTFGGYSPPLPKSHCINNYDFEQWEIIWIK